MDQLALAGVAAVIVGLLRAATTWGARQGAETMSKNDRAGSAESEPS
jgi:hypothetical protein